MIQYQEQQRLKHLRDKIIINEIDKMFGTIRDHQSASAKCKGEMRILKKKKKSASWGYSSNKRHVKAKIMELPFCGGEDLNNLIKNMSIQDINLQQQLLSDNFYENYYDSNTEKVFIRIDDFLNQEVSRFMQRSYSSDYLNFKSGPRTRIRYVKIPNQANANEHQQSLLSTIEHVDDSYYNYAVNATEVRTAPYDLRYWSILKLLEEERQTEQNIGLDGTVGNYFDDTYLKLADSNSYQEWAQSNSILKHLIGMFFCI
jgi:hypothetical protein